MLNVWYKNKVIDLYIEYEVDILVFVKKLLFLSGTPANVFDFDNEICEGCKGIKAFKKP